MPKTSKPRESQYQQTEESKLNDEVDVLIHKISRQIRKCTFDGLHAHDRIERSTRILECLNAGCASMLIKRANALMRIRKLEEAVKDAMKAIEYHPKSPEGYTAACKILIMQVREQDAEEVITAGLRTVPSSNQQSLLELLNVLKKKLTGKTDIISKLPIGVILNIFSRLHTDVLYRCTTVSKSWRYVLTRHCPGLWKTITLTNDHGTSPISLLLPSIGDHIHSLTLRDVNQDVLAVLIDMAANHKLRYLSNVTLAFASTAVPGRPMILLSLLKDKTTKSIAMTAKTLITTTIKVQKNSHWRHSFHCVRI
ncbi:hypothetical protein BJV82DRAFT_284776 [Fennellomyces sp. T-0311]|nr:hypothetical protein BJV82DRAFT_284776 [Fennellomyces sp. T-0311]